MAAIVTVTMNPTLDISFEIERMVPESKLRTTVPARQPGGGGLNVARGCTRLGADVLALWLGGGTDAAALAELLAAEGICHQHVPATGPLRLSMNVEERASGAMYRFVMPGPPVTAAEADVLAARVACETSTQFLVLSGSLPPSLPVDFYAQLAARCPRGTRVILDTSGEPLARGLAGNVYLAKPNRNELGRLLGRELGSVEETVAAARELIEGGRVEVLAVSMAEEGLVLVTRDLADHIRAPKVEMVSAVGAGDSTVAGIVTGLARGMELPRAVRLGVAAGTATVLTPYTELFRREDAERLYAEL